MNVIVAREIAIVCRQPFVARKIIVSADDDGEAGGVICHGQDDPRPIGGQANEMVNGSQL